MIICAPRSQDTERVLLFEHQPATGTIHSKLRETRCGQNEQKPTGRSGDHGGSIPSPPGRKSHGA